MNVLAPMYTTSVLSLKLTIVWSNSEGKVYVRSGIPLPH